ncbi:zinc metalloproteinase dpy-31-like [Saccostrea echinata]|uniref:zinc metalloproteinase dpy-31-like n=1 Tax=Saccostrea echinata TaxID=191078 RepID=UPI002A7FC758|nr:zinc metalloproteinase dpy-31-like [Saccostrea echinata]
MLRVAIIIFLLTVLAASPVEKDGKGKIASESLRELFDENYIDEANLGNRNFEENEIDLKADVENDNEDGSESKQDSSVENENSSEEEPDETKPTERDFLEGGEKAQRVFESSLASSMLQLHDMIGTANPGLKTSKRSMEDMDMIDGDVKLDKESAAELVEFYKRNPQYLRLNNNGSESSVPDPFDKRKVYNGPKWTFPINYRLQIASSTHKTLIKQALSIWQQQTCVSFVERSSITAPAINFKENESGCWSYVGKRSIINDINLQNGCKHLGIILHEIGHALGMWHEQSRQDRNTFVSIITDNIVSGKEHNFLIKSGVTYGTNYDYGSVMHYSDTAFAKSAGLKTIVAKQSDYSRTMGQRIGLSFNDIRAINYHYCQSRCSGGLTWSSCRNGGYRNPRSCGRCKCPDGWIGKYCQYAKNPKNIIRYFINLNLETAGCGYKYRSATSCYRFLNSPGYFFPRSYTNNAECTWKITAPTGKRVRFQFIGSFGITCNTRCLDFVEVRYSSLSNTGPRFCCGTRPTRVFTSTGRVMLVLFRTNSNVVARGFRARFKYV